MVIGGTVAGVAAAARLAKGGRPVVLLESGPGVLGQGEPARSVTFVPPIFAFPAPLRDLFRKSGRPLEAELERRGATLAPASPVCHRFGDGATLRLPTGRGPQAEVLTAAYGPGAADRWRDLLDGLDQTWQRLRRLGFEADLPSRRSVPRAVRRALEPRRTVADLAADTGHPHLAAVVRSVAYRLGSTPDRTPAWCAVQLSWDRTFGRWTVGEADLLAGVLIDRLRLRRVEVRTGERVTAVELDGDGAVTGVVTDRARLPAAAVVATCDPWEIAALLPRRAWRPERRRLHRLRPALAPARTVEQLSQTGAAEETVQHGDARNDGPVIEWRTPSGDGTRLTVEDYRAASPRPAAGIRWDGFRGWYERPPVRSSVPGLFVAGPGSPAGPALSSQLLSGALAAAASAEDR